MGEANHDAAGTPLAAARIFADHYQLILTDDPMLPLPEDEDLWNWTDARMAAGVAGLARFRLIGTEADLNDHWVELVAASQPPEPGPWQRITCCAFTCETGRIAIGGWPDMAIDRRPPIDCPLAPGQYSVFVAGRNIGVDRLSLGERADEPLDDAAFAARRDLEWYRIFLVPGVPEVEGRLRDLPTQPA